ncbi:MAG: hypothetical protein AABX73_02415 [Nanoarchaeota archaeon]
MAVDIKNLIAAINPDVYCDKTYDRTGVRLSDKVKKIAKEEGYLKAAEIAKPIESDYLDIEHTLLTKGAFSLQGFKAPIEKHTLAYDLSSQNLEPIYFWLLDFVNEQYGRSEKLVDNFVSSVGSGHFSEMSRKATVLQEEAMKIFGTVNTVIRSVLNIIYDLKEFKLRLTHYKDLKSSDEKTKNAATLSLKQIWMDNVDIKRGNSSIKAMAQQFDYVTLIDAFMVANSLEEVDKLDINDRVKRILQQRVSEFLKWIKESEKELSKRFEIEKTYLKSQINSLKLYARWLKPYLKTAQQLEQNATANASLVHAFNTSLFELVLLAKGKYEVELDIVKGELPKFFRKINAREYYPITIIELLFRSVPDRTDQRGGYIFRGRADIIFSSYALNDDELKVLKEKVEEDNLGDIYKIIEGATEKSLAELKDDIEEFLGDEKEEEKEKSIDMNPFSALFSSFKKKEEKKDLLKGIPKDTEYEKVLRSQAILHSRFRCRKFYDIFKKVHNMPSFPAVLY